MIPPENENAEIPYDMLKEVMYSFYALQRMLLFSKMRMLRCKRFAVVLKDMTRIPRVR